MLDDLRMDLRPELDRPVMIVAYRGWNDAGSAATHALEYLIGHFEAQPFASIDPDEYYDFTQIRPHTRPLGEYRRELTWAKNDFYYYHGSDGPELLLFLGTEPHLRWRRYSEHVLSLVREVGV